MQYGLRAGLKKFTHRSNAAVLKELTQLHMMDCFSPCDAHTLTCDKCQNVPAFHMFLTERCSGKVKAHVCANCSVQRKHVAREEDAAPTVTSETMFIHGTIFAHEWWDVAMCDIPGAFLQANNPNYVLMHFDSILLELMVTVQICYYKCQRQLGFKHSVHKGSIPNDEKCFIILSKTCRLPHLY